ncbi:hypothetical protein J7L05_00275 [bacterium]|nr:hypothetical protein [bacterium]
MNRKYNIIGLLILVMLFAGCSVQQSENNASKKNKTDKTPALNPNANVESDFGSQGQLLVTMSESNQLALIDLKTLAIGDVTDVGVNPQDVIFSRNGQMYFVVMAGSPDDSETESLSSLSSNAIWMWKTDTHKITGKSSVTIGDKPSKSVGIGTDSAGNRLYITNSIQNNLLIKNLHGEQNDSVTIEVGVGPRRVLVSNDDKYIITINSDLDNRCDNDTVSIIHLLSHDEIARVEVGDTPWGVCIHPNDDRFYVSVSGNNEVKEINIKDGKIINTYEAGKSPRGVAISADGNTLYVASYEEDTVIPLDTKNGKTSEPLSVGKGPVEIALEQNSQILFVANSLSKSITVYNLSQGKAIDTIKLTASPTQMALWSDGIGRAKYDSEIDSKNIKGAMRDIITPSGKIKVKPGNTKPVEDGK